MHGFPNIMPKMIQHSDVLFYTNISLPTNETVQEGQSAEFHCQAASDEDPSSPSSTGFSVAFLIAVPSTASHTDCYNCSFSRSSIDCSGADVGVCGRVEFAYTSTGHPDRQTHELSARWRSAGEEDNGTVVVCAIASRSITQWANSATLTVLPSSPIPMTTTAFSSSPFPSPSSSLTDPSSSSSTLESGLAGLVAALVIVCGAGVGTVLGIAYWRRRGRGGMGQEKHNSHEQSECRATPT